MKRELTPEQAATSRFLSSAIIVTALVIILGSALGLWVKFFWIGFIFAPAC